MPAQINPELFVAHITDDGSVDAKSQMQERVLESLYEGKSCEVRLSICFMEL